MDDRIFKGRLARWNDDRGFGFVRSEGDSQDVFLHISAFKRNISRRPQVGDIISFETHTDNGGKIRAVNATIEGLVPKTTDYNATRLSQYQDRSMASGRVKQPLAATGSHSVTRKPPGKRKIRTGGRWISNAIYFPLLISLAVYGYNKLAYDGGSVSYVTDIPTQGVRIHDSFSCKGKVYCSEMTSCEEARYYISHCPGTKMDGDGDGIPCERQWCGRW